MKENAIFNNTARGEFQNEKDLFEALNSGQIWSAGLDVTNPEPMAHNNPLLELPCLYPPHIGSATIEARNGMARLAAENVLAFVNGEKIPTCANLEVYHRVELESFLT